VNEIFIHGNQLKGQNFIQSVQKKRFLFSLVISYTETCEVPGITIAGANPDVLKYTSPADAEFLHYGYCKSIDSIPVTPDGKPTPAILTKVALESSSIPHVVINAGSEIKPKLPYFETDLKPGKNIAEDSAMDNSSVLQAVDYGRIIGRVLATLTDCLVIGESIPGGTTTALAVLKGLGKNVGVSSSMSENPIGIKNNVVEKAMKRLDSDEPYAVLANMGDPMIPLVSGMISSASDVTKIILAGGTQMAAVLAFSRSIGFNDNNIAIGTTSYIIDDKSANFLDSIKKISDVPVLSVNPNLENSKISGLRSYADGYVKEGAGAGGSIIATMLKTGIDSRKLLELTEKEYQRIITSQ